MNPAELLEKLSDQSRRYTTVILTNAEYRLLQDSHDTLLEALKAMLVFTANDMPNRAIAMAQQAVAKATS